MFSLRGPVSIELILGERTETLDVGEWERVIAKLAPFINEYRLSGIADLLENHGEAGKKVLFGVMAGLDKIGKFYHVEIERPLPDFVGLVQEFRAFSHLGSLLISLPSLNSGVYREITGRDDLQATTEMVEVANSAGFEVNTRVLLCQRNCADVMELAEESFALGVNYVVFYRCVGEANSALAAHKDTLLEALESIKQMRLFGYNVALGNCVPNCFHLSDSYGCMAGVLSAVVDARGNMRPCHSSRRSVGNLLESGVTELWRSEVMEKWRSALPKACVSCAKSSHCPGGCRAFAEESAGADPLIGEPIQYDDQLLHEVTLEEDLCPVPRYVVREEDFGWALIKANQVIPVSRKAGPVLQMFTGSSSLEDIERKFGAGALSFVYSLYVRGFVDFRNGGDSGDEKGGIAE